MAPRPEQDAFLPELVRTFYDALAGFEKETGIHMARWRILVMLGESKKSSQRALAQSSHIDPASISRILRELEAQGYVARAADPSDSRQSLAMLTASGKALVRDIAKRRAKFLRKALKGLAPEEVTKVTETLLSIRRNLADLR